MLLEASDIIPWWRDYTGAPKPPPLIAPPSYAHVVHHGSIPQAKELQTAPHGVKIMLMDEEVGKEDDFKGAFEIETISNPVAEIYEHDEPFQTHWDSLKIASPRRRASPSALTARDIDIDDIDMEMTMPPPRRTRESFHDDDGFADPLAPEGVRSGSNPRWPSRESLESRVIRVVEL